MSSPRLNTKLEAEGAEFLVLGQLLIHKVEAYKAYTNMPDYDLIAVNQKKKTSARIQVKSRWTTGAGGFLIKKVACDFVVVVLLNRGSKDGRKSIYPPEYIVIPARRVKHAHSNVGWGKVKLSDLRKRDEYIENWELISDFLKKRK